MYMYKALLTVTLFLLVGCGLASEPNSTSDIEIDFTNSSSAQSLQQEASNEAKKALSENDDITSIKAVNSNEDIIIAIEIEHLKRFNLKKIRKNIQEDMKKKFPELNVIVSADKKIILELEKLEEQIASESISKKEINNRVKKIASLSKEQT